MNHQISESDWKLFRIRLPGWQEAYMDQLNNEYIAILSGPEKASDKFWTLEKRIRQDKRDTGVVAEVTRSMMETNIMNLLGEGAITLDDLDGFSDDLREKMAFLMRRRDND